MQLLKRMTKPSSFEVVVRRKIPYVTKLLFYLLIISTIVFFILSLIFLPANDQSDEMTTAYFILTVPEFIQKALFISGTIFLILLLLHTKARLYKSAIINFYSETITIVGQKLNLVIPVTSIVRAFCMDAKNLQGISKEKLTIYFELENDKEIRVRLKDYTLADQFMTELTKYENIKFKFYDFEVSPGDEE